MVLAESKTRYYQPIYEPPTSYPYDAVKIIDRIFELTDPDNIFRHHAVAYLEQAVKNAEYTVKPLDVGAAIWNDANALINRVIAVEETRVMDSKSWEEVKKILLTSI